MSVTQDECESVPHTRTLNHYFDDAIHTASKQSFEWSDCYGNIDRLRSDARIYRDETSSKVILLKGESNLDNKKGLVLDYITRFDDSYAKRQIQALDDVRKAWSANMNFKNGHPIFFTITCDPKKYFSEKQMHKDISKRWNRLTTHIRMYLKRQGRSKWGYVRVFEVQKNNSVLHIHAIFIGLNWLPIKWVKQAFGDVQRNIQLIHKGIGGAFAYLKKYITKTFEGLNDTKIILWALRARAYSKAGPLSLTAGLTNSNNDEGFEVGITEFWNWVYIGTKSIYEFSLAPGFYEWGDVLYELELIYS